MPEVRSIYSDRCWLDGKLQPASIVFDAARIIQIFPFKTSGAEDVGDDVLMPGIIDAHVHINEPGRTDWEGFITATQAAAAGGITTIIDMPLNASPVTTTLHALKEKLEAAHDKLYVNTGFYGGLVPGNRRELEPLIVNGVFGIKCFLAPSGIEEFPNVSEADIDQSMPLIAGHGVPLLAHCELLLREPKTALSEFPRDYRQYLLSRPKQWENDAVQLMIKLCRKHNCPIHIVHVSSAEALEIIALAKAEGLPVTAETCPHYIYFNSEGIPDGNTIFKCAPPIREKANNNLLKAALKNGVLDFITTDHSPAPPEIKKIDIGDFEKGWGGIAGLQFLLPASWTALRDVLEIEGFIPLLTERPAKFLNLHHRKGRIEVGFDADFVIWNPEKKKSIKVQDVYHRHKISPYVGEELYGTITKTIVGGSVVFDNEKIIDGTTPNGTAIFRNKNNA